MTLSEFVYTVILKQNVIRKIVNRFIFAILPKTIHVGPAVICLNPKDPVVSGALLFRVFERQELKLASHIFREGMTIVDVGANVGLYTAIAMHCIKKQGRIIAFEPHPESCRFLLQTVKVNATKLPLHEQPQINIFDVALSASEGKARLFTNSENKGDNRLYSSNLTPELSALSIRTRTLDSVMRDYKIATIEFLKLDVQGYEFEVI